MFGSHGDGHSVILNVNSHIKRGELRCVTPRDFLRGRDALGNTIHVLKTRTQGFSNQQSDRDSELFRARGDGCRVFWVEKGVSRRVSRPVTF